MSKANILGIVLTESIKRKYKIKKCCRNATTRLNLFKGAIII